MGEEIVPARSQNEIMVRTRAPLYVVRHADAGIRGHDPHDHLRPLSSSGQARAQFLADLLAHASVGDIVSSPYVRCIETVEPLATRRRCGVVLSDELAEGAGIRAILRLLKGLPDGSVACTHGDVLGQLADVLVDTRREHEVPISLDKGVVWVLSRDGDGLSLVDQMPASLSMPWPCEGPLQPTF
jgi:8-oxo-dGTP diphosphatase